MNTHHLRPVAAALTAAFALFGCTEATESLVTPTEESAAVETTSSALELPFFAQWKPVSRYRQRGIWMYHHDGHVYGTSTIVGDDVREAWAVSRLRSWRIKRVYGSYRDMPTDQRTDVATWNHRLNRAGIDSELLLGAPQFIFPGADCRDRLFEQIQERLIDFHDSPPGTPLGTSLSAAARFDALHLDIEPHQFKDSYFTDSSAPDCATDLSAYWNEGASRAALFALLYDTYVDVRIFLDLNGYAHLPIRVDLPFWVDTSASFNWADTPGFVDGTDWIQQAGEVVDSMTFMTYERDNAPDIRATISGEDAAIAYAPEIRASVNAKERSPHSSIHTWLYLNDFWDVVEAVEFAWGPTPDYPVDLHNFKYMASLWPMRWISVDVWATRSTWVRRLLAAEQRADQAAPVDEPQPQVFVNERRRGEDSPTRDEATVDDAETARSER